MTPPKGQSRAGTQEPGRIEKAAHPFWTRGFLLP
jgi:hypothetical protein